MQILFIGSHVTGWLADSLLADLSFPWSLLRKTRFSRELWAWAGAEQSVPKSERSLLNRAAISKWVRICSCWFSSLSLNWNLWESPQAWADLIHFFSPLSLSLWEQLWITRIHRELLFKSVWPNLKVTKEEHLKMSTRLDTSREIQICMCKNIYWACFAVACLCHFCQIVSQECHWNSRSWFSFNTFDLGSNLFQKYSFLPHWNT